MGDPTFKVIWPFDNVVTWKIQKTYICSSAIPMATKLGRVRTCSWGTPPLKSRDLLIKWSRGKFKKLISSLSQYPTIGRVVTYRRKTHIHSQVIFWVHGHVTNLKTYICSLAIPMATKLGREGTCGWGSPPSKSCIVLIMWSRDKFKN